MTQNNDLELATHVRNIQKLAGDLDRAMREDTRKQLWREIYNLTDEASFALYRLNILIKEAA